MRDGAEARGEGKLGMDVTRIEVENKVGFPVNLNLIAGHELAESAGLDHGGQRFLGGRDKLVREVCTTRNAGAQLEFRNRSQTTRIKVVLIEGGPDASGKAWPWRTGLLCVRQALLGRASSNSRGGIAEAGETPVIARQWGTEQATKFAPFLEVGSSQGARLERGRDGPTGVENLGPSGARSKHCESPMSIPPAADGTDESRRLGHPFREE